MGTGSSGKGTSGAYTTRRELTAQDGSKIDLSANPLRYGSNANLNDRERQAIDGFENKRAGSKIEFGTLVDTNGNVLIEKKGGKGSVSMPTRLYNQASVMSHVHPRSGSSMGMLGGTFSGGDINAFTSTNIRTMRATALEGTYSISKGNNFNAAGLSKYFNDNERSLRATLTKRTDEAYNRFKTVRRDFDAKKATYEQYKAAYDRFEKERKDVFNTYLVDTHNALISGQTQYGYTYTLERRK